LTTRTEAIKAILSFKTHADLTALYNEKMECQVNVAQDNGERIEGEYEGVKWLGYTDGITTWKSFRIPYNAKTSPEYVDKDISFDIMHAEAVGMTGWNWKDRISLWVAFDFDAIIGHSDKHTRKLSPDELKKIQDLVQTIPWVTVRYSTSGKGLHIYVFIEPVKTDNHTEHAALARAILAKMTSLTGFNFESKVDIAGGNMWVYHRKMINTDGLKLIKQGEILREIPPNWKDHLNVVRGTSKKSNIPFENQNFENLSSQNQHIKLDADHLKLIKYLSDNGYLHWWDQDHHMLITHTLSLKKAHTDLSFRGIFETSSSGSTQHNCFAFPLRQGGWSIRRYSPGVKEHISWEQDGQKWTRCFYNVEPTLRSASIAKGAIEDPSGGYHFKDVPSATDTALLLGVKIDLPTTYNNRNIVLKPNKDNRLVVEMPATDLDNPADLTGWLRKGSKWIRLYQMPRSTPQELDMGNFDDVVRHMITETGQGEGWSISIEGKWINEPLEHVKLMLESIGLKPPEIKAVAGGSVTKPWTIVSRPFQPEYPGDRMWNKGATQFRFPPSLSDTLVHPTWNKILNHIGCNLDNDIRLNKWCKSNGINTGAEYLKVWAASMIQYPTEPLPYLFIYSEEQNTGKSTFHEALSLLFYPGYQYVDHAILNQSGFNAELEGTILCVIEETDLSKQSSPAYNKIKEWVTSPKISIHKKFMTPYLIDNTCHFIQCAQNRRFIPIFPGDTRILMICVKPFATDTSEIPKRVLLRQLEKEGPDFLASLLNLEIPESPGRLRLPLIDTADKLQMEESNKNALQQFIDEKCFYSPGQTIAISEFFDKFSNWLDPAERNHWFKKKVSTHMPDKYVKGRHKSNGQANWHWGNISFVEPEVPSLVEFAVSNGYLYLKELSPSNTTLQRS